MKVNLDISKLLGFRILQAEADGSNCSHDALGTRLGVKAGRKIGLKLGNKPGGPVRSNDRSSRT